MFQWNVPSSWASWAGQGSWLFEQWKILAVALGAAFFAYLWATDPSQRGRRTVHVWWTSVVCLVLGGILGVVGLVYMGEVKLHTYGAMISLGFFFGVALSIREAKRVGMSGDHILDLVFWMLIASMIGA
ncbi:MAG: prolipoprotein diacylglyceryl transferase family protein, partial [Myxococcota bacterium]